MPGFFISNHFGRSEMQVVFPDRCLFERIVDTSFSIQRNTLRRFMDDKAFVQTGDYIIISEGVILNKNELYASYSSKNVPELISCMYEQQGEDFFKEFRGSFSGSLYDKKKEIWLVWTNHYGDNAVFYAYQNGVFHIGSQFDTVLESLSQAKTMTTIDENAVYFELTFGFMEDDSTFVQEIKRLQPGSYLKVGSAGLSCFTYWAASRIGEGKRYSGESESEVIDNIDRLFRRAVKREFDKDIEYGYRHMANMSGGMDSRMTTWVAHEMGYLDILNTSFCQTGNPDESIAKEISSELGNEFIFKSLDDASFMFDLDIHISMLYGLSIYSGLTGGRRLLQAINMDDFGLEHTGQGTDIAIGSYLTKPSQAQRSIPDGYYSNKLIQRVDGECNHANYADHELYMIHTRGYLGMLSSHFLRRNYTEVSSPGLDPDLMDYCLSLPLKLRTPYFGHRLYRNWVMKKYPRAASFVWEWSGVAFNQVPPIMWLSAALRKGPKILCKRLGITMPQRRRDSMNPMDYWWKNNAGLRDFFSHYYDHNMPNLPISEQLKEDIEFLYVNGNTLEKSQALTAIATIRYCTERQYF